MQSFVVCFLFHGNIAPCITAKSFLVLVRGSITIPVWLTNSPNHTVSKVKVTTHFVAKNVNHPSGQIEQQISLPLFETRYEIVTDARPCHFRYLQLEDYEQRHNNQAQDQKVFVSNRQDRGSSEEMMIKSLSPLSSLACPNSNT